MLVGGCNLLMKSHTVRVLYEVRRTKIRKKDHWAVLQRKNKPKDKALQHFDDFYKTVYGEKSWRSIRLALLCPNKYCAIVNNFDNPDGTIAMLEDRGALNMKDILAVNSRYKREGRLMKQIKEDGDSSSYKLDSKMETILQKKQNDKYGKYYTEGNDEEVLNEDNGCEEDKYTEKLSLEQSLLEANLDYSRIVNPKDSISGNSLYEFVPATKLKGMDDFIPESQHYNYYKKNIDFPIEVETEDAPVRFPGSLSVYVYEKCNVSPFPYPSLGNSCLLDYYLLDGASVIPVLALDLSPSDYVLDMCAAPGGKAMAAIQSMCAEKVVCNDTTQSRIQRILKVLNEYISPSHRMTKIVDITAKDGREFSEVNVFNKILVDVPCTVDRHSLKAEGSDNIFHPSRIKERLKIPELQSELLSNALKLVRVGGTVVYSTCSLSPVQNDGVVQMALRDMWEETNHQFVVKDLSESFAAIDAIYYLCNREAAPKYGIQILPHLTANFGPLYVSKIVKVR